jgi:hypothetical protein
MRVLRRVRLHRNFKWIFVHQEKLSRQFLQIKHPLWFAKQHLSYSAVNSLMLSVMSYKLKINPILLKLVTPKKYKYEAMRTSYIIS